MTIKDFSEDPKFPVNKLKLSETSAQKARRANFKESELAGLSQSIQQFGFINPITVRYSKDDHGKDQFIVVCGERRLLAAKLLKLNTVPIKLYEMEEEDEIEMQLVENLQRKDLHPMHEAEGYEALLKLPYVSVEDIYNRIGKSKSYVYKRLKLLHLSSKLREAFYKEEISISIALIISRLESKKDQEECLKQIRQYKNWGEVFGPKELQDFIEDEIMLLLGNAPFDLKDETLITSAGSCTHCPKSTKNQPELFEDIKTGARCTDSACYKAKLKIVNDRKLAEAKANGANILSKKESKKIAPHGLDNHLRDGWVNLDDKNFQDSKNRTNRQILGDLEGVETAILQDADDGAAIHIVKEKDVKKALGVMQKQKGKEISTEAKQQKKAKFERLFRRQLYFKIRSEIPAPDDLHLIKYMLSNLSAGHLKLVCELNGFEPRKNNYGHKDYSTFIKTVDKMTDNQVAEVMNDCLFAAELCPQTWDCDAKPTTLLNAAKSVDFDTLKLRNELKPKPKQAPAKKKASAKKKAPAKKKKGK